MLPSNRHPTIERVCMYTNLKNLNTILYSIRLQFTSTTTQQDRVFYVIEVLGSFTELYKCRLHVHIIDTYGIVLIILFNNSWHTYVFCLCINPNCNIKIDAIII